MNESDIFGNQESNTVSLVPITEIQDGVPDVSNELESFREQWKTEVAGKHQQNFEKKKAKQSEDESKSDKAKEFFLQGIENERSGRMHHAIASYRTAMQLDPEVEQKMFEASDFQQPHSDEELSHYDGETTLSLVEKLSSLQLSSTRNNTSNVLVTSLNISQLPSEILCYIFHWVASSHMDMKSIEALSQTCRKFYLHARDQAVWRSACERIWGIHETKKGFLSWRDMYIRRPHVRLDGVYISKVSYFRQGDPTVFSTNYQPFQCVEYYRYIRFFDNGSMIFHTTSDEPATVIPKLHFKHATQLKFRVGRYKSHSEQREKVSTCRIAAILVERDARPTSRSYKRASRHEKKYILTESEYILELELSSTSPKKQFNKLSWVSYSCRFKFGESGRSIKDDINIRDQYPAFYFSGVRSYNKRAEAALK